MTEERTISDLFTRDGHLSELTVNRYLAAELAADERAAVDEHAGECGPCAARVDAVRAFDAAFAIAPPAAPSNVVSLAEARARRGPLFALIAAAAAVALVLVVARPDSGPVAPGEDDGIRMKGADLDLSVFAKTGDAAARAVGDGDIVHPGDRLGFQLGSRHDGFTMIVGIDERGEVYAAWPQDAGGKAKFLAATEGARDLGAAIRLDDVGARERIVAVRCAEPFDFAAAANRLKQATALQKQPTQDPLANCVYDEVSLKKQAR